MRYLRTILSLASTIIIQPAFANDDHSLISPDVQNYIGFGTIVAMLLLFIIVMIVLLRTFNVLTRIILKSGGYTDEQITIEFKPVRNEKKPPLVKYLSYGTIGIGIIGILVYYAFGTAQSKHNEPLTKETEIEIAKKSILNKEADNVDENTVKLVTDTAVLASGKAVFMQSCSACHGAQAQGMVGPNLIDDYWLHGGKIGDVFKSIKNGIPAKGMPTWEKQLSPKQISDVANYIKSLHGTNPANAKEPQGTRES